MQFIDHLKTRRTIYNLGKNVNIAHSKIIDAIEIAVQNSPSAFNSQSARVLVLFGEQHHKLWEIVKSALKAVVPAEAFAQSEARVNTFQAGYASILFFEEQDTIKGLQAKLPTYADNFPLWSEQSTAIAQFAVWLVLENLGLGVSIQHYNPLIDQAVATTWNIPASWQLKGQMPFGSIEAPAAERTDLDIKERVRVVE